MLDKSKPYGEIIGSTDGSKFEQNGKVYDFQGEEIAQVVNQATEQPVAEEIVEQPRRKYERKQKGE